jgi:hypothetical protein
MKYKFKWKCGSNFTTIFGADNIENPGEVEFRKHKTCDGEGILISKTNPLECHYSMFRCDKCGGQLGTSQKEIIEIIEE